VSAEVIHGDCLDVMRWRDADTVDAVVTDPPYGLSFMGKHWDHGVPGVGFWVAALRLLKPGARLLAFGGTRTYHRMACAIEDAGFEIEDSLCWLYGSGFPKHKSKLKPAHEPIVMARKPAPRATPLNIDDCRLDARPDDPNVRDTSLHTERNRPGFDGGWQAAPKSIGFATTGRWPANVVLDEVSAELLDQQSGDRPSCMQTERKRCDTPSTFTAGRDGYGYGDTGGASRFFYCAKSSRREREAGLEDGPVRVFAAGNGGQAALARGDETSRQGKNGVASLNKAFHVRNHHPTVKPVALMRWLVRLVTPPDGLVLDPFTGSGTTGIAATLEGRHFLGIEREAEYVEIARARIAHAQPALGVA
jgi:DNA modification methylase